jgi:hypothetical protein
MREKAILRAGAEQGKTMNARVSRIQPTSSSSPSTTYGALTTRKMPLNQFDSLLEIMQADATQRMVAYYHHARLIYDGGLAQKILSKISANMARKVGTTQGQAVVEGAKALELIRSTVAEIMSAVNEAVGAQAASAGISDAILAAVKDRATELATKAFGPAFVAQAAPFIGLIPSAYSAVTKTYAAVDGIVKATHASRYAKVVKIGAPRAAADAVGDILKRKAAYLTTTAATSVTNFGASVATAASTGIAAALDLPIKIATAVVDLIAELTMFALELYEHAAGDRTLEMIGTWDHELLIENEFAGDIFPVAFNVCPLLGCYMLASAPYFNTSDFVALSAGPGTLASVDEIERIAVQKVNPLRLYASQIIAESKIKLTHDRRSDLKKIMDEAVYRAQAVEANSLKGRAKSAVNSHIVDPLKKKWASLWA